MRSITHVLFYEQSKNRGRKEREDGMKCKDCETETFHENGLCTCCYDKRFNDPRRKLSNGCIQVQGPLPAEGGKPHAPRGQK